MIVMCKVFPVVCFDFATEMDRTGLRASHKSSQFFIIIVILTVLLTGLRLHRVLAAFCCDSHHCVPITQPATLLHGQMETRSSK